MNAITTNIPDVTAIDLSELPQSLRIYLIDLQHYLVDINNYLSQSLVNSSGWIIDDAGGLLVSG